MMTCLVLSRSRRHLALPRICAENCLSVVCQSYVTHLRPITTKHTSNKPSFSSKMFISGFCSVFFFLEQLEETGV